MRLAVAVLVSLMSITAFAQEQPLRVAIVGLEHGHIGGFLKQFPNQHEFQLVGIVESDAELALFSVTLVQALKNAAKTIIMVAPAWAHDTVIRSWQTIATPMSEAQKPTIVRKETFSVSVATAISATISGAVAATTAARPPEMCISAW